MQVFNMDLREPVRLWVYELSGVYSYIHTYIHD